MSECNQYITRTVLQLAAVDDNHLHFSLTITHIAMNFSGHRRRLYRIGKPGKVVRISGPEKAKFKSPEIKSTGISQLSLLSEVRRRITGRVGSQKIYIHFSLDTLYIFFLSIPYLCKAFPMYLTKFKIIINNIVSTVKSTNTIK